MLHFPVVYGSTWTCLQWVSNWHLSVYFHLAIKLTSNSLLSTNFCRHWLHGILRRLKWWWVLTAKKRGRWSDLSNGMQSRIQIFFVTVHLHAIDFGPTEEFRWQMEYNNYFYLDGQWIGQNFDIIETPRWRFWYSTCRRQSQKIKLPRHQIHWQMSRRWTDRMLAAGGFHSQIFAYHHCWCRWRRWHDMCNSSAGAVSLLRIWKGNSLGKSVGGSRQKLWPDAIRRCASQ